MATKKTDNDTTAAGQDGTPCEGQGGTSSRRRRVAAVRFSALGDVAMTVPVLYDACASNPGVDFVMVTRKAFVGIFVNAPANLTVMGVDLKGQYHGAHGMMKLATDIDADTLIDLHDVLRTKLLRLRMRLRGKRVVTFDKARAAKRQLIRNGQFGAPAVSATTDRYADAFRAAGLKLDGTFSGLYAAHPADPALFAAVHSPKPTGARWVGVAPFAAHAGKMYDSDSMRRVVDSLAELPGTHVFLFGGGGTEADTMLGWAAGHADTVSVVAGSGIGFAGELALMNQLDVMLTMDSGNMHLAAAAGTRTVSLWGATNPKAGFAPWQPQGQRRHCTMCAPYKCSPCSAYGNKPCALADSPKCINSLDPADIVRNVTLVAGGGEIL